MVEAALIMAFGIIMLFVVPSLFMIMTSQFYEQRKMPIEVLRLYGVALCAWVICINLVLIFSVRDYSWIAMLIPFLATAAYGAWRADRLCIGTVTTSRLQALGGAVALALLATISVCGTAFGMILSFSMGAAIKGIHGWQETMLAILCVLIAMIGLIPGFMFLYARTLHIGGIRPLKFASMGVVAVAYMLASATAFLPSVQLKYLRTLGVYSDERRTFQVMQPELAPMLTLIGVPVDSSVKPLIASGWVRYQFGGTRMLCAKDFDPATAFVYAGAGTRKSELDPGILGGKFCVKTKDEELREFKK